MRTTHFFSLTLVLATIFSSCSKESTAPNTNNGNNGGNSSAKTPKELVAKTWQLETCVDNTPGTTTPDLMQDCWKDDALTFNADGTYKMDAGTHYCDPSDPDFESTTGVWNIDNYPMLIIRNDKNTTGDSDTLVIDQLDKTTLKYHQDFDDVGNTFTSTWKKK